MERLTWSSSLAGRVPLSRPDELLNCGKRISHRPADFQETRSRTGHAGLGQPRQRHAKELGDLRRMQQGVEFVGLRRGTHGPLSFSCCAHQDAQCCKQRHDHLRLICCGPPHSGQSRCEAVGLHEITANKGLPIPHDRTARGIARSNFAVKPLLGPAPPHSCASEESRFAGFAV